MSNWPYEDISGQTFNEWSVLDYQGKGLWRCKCSCGYEKNQSKSLLRNNKSTRCDNCRRKEWSAYNTRNNKERELAFGESSFHSCYRSYRQNAKLRGIDFNLTREVFKELTQQNCYWCGKEPSNVFLATKQSNGSYTYNGIDRFDNSIGYVEDNIVPCCKRCNSAKNDMTVDEFKSWIKDLYHNIFEGTDS